MSVPPACEPDEVIFSTESSWNTPSLRPISKWRPLTTGKSYGLAAEATQWDRYSVSWEPVSVTVATGIFAAYAGSVVGLVTGERPSALALVGIVIAVTAVALVSGAIGTHQHNTPRRIVVLAVGVGACFGLLFVALDRADAASGVWPLVIARLASVPLLFAIAGASGARPARHRASLQLAVVAGVFDMGANVLYLAAVRGGMLAIVSVVASLYPASTVALAFTIDGERLTKWQAVGLGAAALALVLVSLSRQ